MKLTPVMRYSQPGYPSRAILDAHPELLRLVPKRWRRNRLVLAALGTVCVLLVGCRQTTSKGTAAAMSRVAPVFLHGEGRGALGCRAVNPPVFLSEDEARQVVREEAKKAGIEFAAGGSTGSVKRPLTDRYGPDVTSEPTPHAILPTKAPTRRGPLDLDGTDTKRRIAYEVVTAQDFEAWERKGTVGPTVYVYDLRGTTLVLRESLVSRKPAGVYGVFYDPAAHRYLVDERGWPKHDDAQAQSYDAKVAAEEDLRKQVRDFVAWLKAQGVI